MKSVIKMAVALSPDQELATKAFLDALSETGASCVSRATAIKFLLARKFDVARAHTLWRQHEATRRREGLIKFEPFEDPLKSELETGKFTILPTRDATGAAIAVFTANKHFPTQTSHQTTLQGVVYQLDCALSSPDTQRAGLVFVYDMTDSKYTNFDYELSQKILTMLKGGYPAKLKKVLIVTAPLWFKAPFRILRLFVREKLRERVHTVSAPQLGAHVPRASLPKQLGGQLEPDHAAWLEYCRNAYTNTINSKLDGVIDDYVISNHIPPIKPQNGIIDAEVSCDMTERADIMHISDAPYTCDPNPLRHTHGYNGDMKATHINSGDEDDLDLITRGTWSSGEASPGASDEECGGGGAAESPAALLARVRALGRRGLAAEYDEIRARPLGGTFHHAKLPANVAKNRYTDVLCYDHSRVVLSTLDDDPSSDYINANYVDGYKQKNAFICTQGPLPKTFGDFWRMVWEQGCLVVVMTTRTVERGRVKCGQYWPAPGARAEHRGLAVTTEAVDEGEHYTVSHLVLTDLRTEQRRRVWHGQYTRWPDYGVPGGGRAAPVLRFLHDVRRAQQRARAESVPAPSPPATSLLEYSSAPPPPPQAGRRVGGAQPRAAHRGALLGGHRAHGHVPDAGRVHVAAGGGGRRRRARRRGARAGAESALHTDARPVRLLPPGAAGVRGDARILRVGRPDGLRRGQRGGVGMKTVATPLQPAVNAAVPRRQGATTSGCHVVTVSRCHGATASRCHGATASRCHGVTVPRCHGATASRCHGATASRCHGVTVPRRHGATASRCHGATASRCHGVTVPRCHGVTVPRRHGATASRCHGVTVPRRHGATASRCHGVTVPRCHGVTVPRRHGVTVPLVARSVVWDRGCVVQWSVGRRSVVSEDGECSSMEPCLRPDVATTKCG